MSVLRYVFAVVLIVFAAAALVSCGGDGKKADLLSPGEYKLSVSGTLEIEFLEESASISPIGALQTHTADVSGDVTLKMGDDGSFSLEHRRFDVHTGRSEADWHFIGANGERRHQFHSVRLYTLQELAAMLARAGLRVRRTWGNFDGSELSMHSPRMIVLAEKR